MHPRQEAILKIIIEEYVRSAEPVGSAFLVDRYDLGVSPATVRNDMAALETSGFLTQPHTSSGRIPTSEAYRYYLSTWLKDAPTEAVVRKLRTALRQVEDTATTLHALAQFVGEMTGELAVVSTASRHMELSGLANLFAKPDFQNVETMRELSVLVDRLEGILTHLFPHVFGQPSVLVGADSPCGDDMALILLKVPLFHEEGLVGILGPLRMNYGHNVQVLRALQEVLV